VVFLPELGKQEALELLRRRWELVSERRDKVAGELAVLGGPMLRFAGDHLLKTIEAELSLVAEALRVVGGTDWVRPDGHG